MPEATTTEDMLRVSRVIKAPRQKVYEAFTDPDLLARWFHPGPMRTEVHTWNPKKDGPFHIAMIADQGEMAGEHVARGRFIEVVPGERLVQTWRWDSDDPNMATESRVTVLLKDTAGGTEVTFVHELLPSKESVDAHLEGWTGCLENLAALF